MIRIILLFFVFILSLLFSVTFIRAEDIVVSSSAKLIKTQYFYDKEFDLRIIRLKNYLEQHNSPLSQYSSEFIEQADAHDLDWRLLPAIAGVESTFGKRIPKDSYNAYGWNNGNFRFNSWENSIEHVSKTLREKYYDRGATNIVKIARRYAPPSTSWSWKVKFFMEKIDPTPIEFDL